MIELRQSRIQDLLNRLYEAACQAFYLVIGAALATMLGGPPQAVWPAVAIGFLLALLVSAWLFIYNRRPIIPTTVVQLTGEGVRLARYGEEVRRIHWTEFADYTITYLPPRRIKIRAREGRALSIDLYALSAAQRDVLIEELDRRLRTASPKTAKAL